MMKDYLALIAEAIGVTPKFEYGTPEDVLAKYPDHVNRRGMLFACEHMCCDIAKADAELGLVARHAPRRGPQTHHPMDARRRAPLKSRGTRI